MPKCTTESWKMKDIVSALKTEHYNNKKIVIPRFQRGKRWSESQELSFIDSLKKGYPVGTLLFYRTTEIVNNNPIEIYTLVDGLQRSTAIARYLTNPMKYYNKDNVPEQMLSDVYNVLGFPGQEVTLKSKIKEIFYNYIRNLPSFDGEYSFNLAQKIVEEIPVTEKMQVIGALMGILPPYLSLCKQDFEIISNTEIPAVVYTGSEDDLPEIFNRINSKGTPLNPFEIYAASWPQTEKYSIHNEKIIDHVLKKYDSLNDDIYTIRGYDRSEISQQKRLTIFEYVFGLSKWLNHSFPILAFEIKDKPDEISQIGFELLDACIFESKNIGELYKYLVHYDINKLEKRLVECIKIVGEIITPITRFKGNSRKDDHSILYAKNQIIAMIAFVFKEKYDLNNLNAEKVTWHTNEQIIRKQLYHYFIYDIIRQEWSEGGGKLHTAVNTKRFLEEISPSAWNSALDAMFEDSKKKKETKSVKNPSNIDIVFLNAIYVSKFSALDQLSADRFDIEHIATKDLMKRLIKNSCPDDNLEGLPISSIANLCYLPEYQNRAKGNKTFYQDNTYLHGLSLSDIETKYSFTEREDLEWVDLDYEIGDFNSLQEFYLDFLNTRFEKQKQEFYSAMGIDATQITVTENTSRTIPAKPRSITDSSAGQEKNAQYEAIHSKLESKYNTSLTFVTKTLVSNQEYSFSLAYSKLYMQGTRHKYWFAYRPNKIQNLLGKRYYIFACKEDDVAFSLPFELLETNKNSLNRTLGDNEKQYYHIVLFVDVDNNGQKKYSWMLSRPTIREIDISEYLI